MRSPIITHKNECKQCQNLPRVSRGYQLPEKDYDKIAQLDEYFRRVFPREEDRKDAQDFVLSALKREEKKITIFQGEGSNGKTVFESLLSHAFYGRSPRLCLDSCSVRPLYHRFNSCCKIYFEDMTFAGDCSFSENAQKLLRYFASSDDIVSNLVIHHYEKDLPQVLIELARSVEVKIIHFREVFEYRPDSKYDFHSISELSQQLEYYLQDVENRRVCKSLFSESVGTVYPELIQKAMHPSRYRSYMDHEEVKWLDSMLG